MSIPEIRVVLPGDANRGQAWELSDRGTEAGNGEPGAIVASCSLDLRVTGVEPGAQVTAGRRGLVPATTSAGRRS